MSELADQWSAEGRPDIWDSASLEECLYNETRYTMLRQSHPEEAKKLLEEAREDVAARWKMYETWASMGASGKG
jgi:pyruvate/2-oxoacid:ferredoxin oxidoreductase beta subunit